MASNRTSTPIWQQSTRCLLQHDHAQPRRQVALRRKQPTVPAALDLSSAGIHPPPTERALCLVTTSSRIGGHWLLVIFPGFLIVYLSWKSGARVFGCRK
jgi:hypothetical protein